MALSSVGCVFQGVFRNPIVSPDILGSNGVDNKGGGNTITMEEVMAADPDVILLDAGGIYETVKDDPYWSGLTAINEDRALLVYSTLKE